jgi:hypothetical protein
MDGRGNDLSYPNSRRAKHDCDSDILFLNDLFTHLNSRGDEVDDVKTNNEGGDPDKREHDRIDYVPQVNYFAHIFSNKKTAYL